MPLTPDDRDVLKADLEKNPNCVHSTVSSSQMSWINGKSESSEILKVYRRCQDSSRNGIVIERTEKGDGSGVSLNGKADEMFKGFFGPVFGGMKATSKDEKESMERAVEAMQRQNSNPFNPKPKYRYSPD